MRVSGSEYSTSEPEERPRPRVVMVVSGNSCLRMSLRCRAVWSASGWTARAMMISVGVLVLMEVMSWGMRAFVWSLLAMGMSAPRMK